MIKYTIFFGFLAGWFFWLALFGISSYRYVFIWPAINMLLFASAYSINNPWLLCGKKRDGEINLFLVLLNLPWLTFAWSILTLQKVTSKENFVDHIEGTNWYISSYPGLSYESAKYDFIVDLTAEFPRAKNGGDKYICYPNLDGIALSNLPSKLDIDTDTRVLVHCAQGHGRSATWSSLALANLGAFDDAKSAYLAIRSSRPGANASKSQEQQILSSTN